MKKIRLLLADDHAILRAGLRALLERERDLEVVGEAEDGRSAVSLAAQLRPDVILMDVAMPLLNGIDATRLILREQPDARVLILSMYESEDQIREALAAGALGYLVKESGSDELLCAVRRAARGEAVLTRPVTRLVAEDALRWGDRPAATPADGLTCREREILQLIAEGYTNKQIADILEISIKTVETHRGNLMRKLDLHDRGELIKYAIQRKIIGPF